MGHRGQSRGRSTMTLPLCTGYLSEVVNRALTSLRLITIREQLTRECSIPASRSRFVLTTKPIQIGITRLKAFLR